MMSGLWIPITIAAAFFQNLRSALQKAIKGKLSTTGASYARFAYALPLALLYLGAVGYFGQYELPEPNLNFLIYCAVGGVSQIFFTVVLLWMFSFRSFAVGTTFSKLEVILIAIIGAILLGDTVGPVAILAILVGAVGTIVLSLAESNLSVKNMIRGVGEKSTLAGLLCASLLGGSVVCFRGAALALDGPDFIMAAAFTLAVALTLQCLMMGIYFLAFDREELWKVFKYWRSAAPVGLAGMAASVCWFTAFTLQNAAYVRALGQIELVFTFAASIFWFKERITLSECIGIGLIAGAILLILVAG